MKKAKSRLAHNKNKRRYKNIFGGYFYAKPTDGINSLLVVISSLFFSFFIYVSGTRSNAQANDLINPYVSPYASQVESAKQAFPTLSPTPIAERSIKAERGVNNSVEKIIIEEWGEDSELGLRIAFCESSYRPNIESDHSTASGLFQFIDWTWVWVRGKMGGNQSFNLKLDARE